MRSDTINSIVMNLGIVVPVVFIALRDLRIFHKSVN